MGCDIHLVVERRRQGEKWIGIFSSDNAPGRPKIAQRDYDFFSKIANVRGSGGRYPRNVPKDISDLAWDEYMASPTDHHSASHETLAEFCDVYLSVNPSAARKEFAAFDLFGLDPSYPENCEYRVVFWFDN